MGFSIWQSLVFKCNENGCDLTTESSYAASGLDLYGLAGEQAPVALVFEPDEEDRKVRGAGFAAIVGCGGQDVTHPGGIADDPDGLLGEIDGDKVGGFVEQGR